jgi:hypothetical protein
LNGRKTKKCLIITNYTLSSEQLEGLKKVLGIPKSYENDGELEEHIRPLAKWLWQNYGIGDHVWREEDAITSALVVADPSDHLG